MECELFPRSRILFAQPVKDLVAFVITLFGTILCSVDYPHHDTNMFRVNIQGGHL